MEYYDCIDMELENIKCLPEQKLCIAVIIQAVKDIHLKTLAGITLPSSSRKHIKKSAINWIMSNDTHPFSFLWCLETIFPTIYDTMDINKVRQTLLEKALKCKRVIGQNHPHKKNLSLYIKQ